MDTIEELLAKCHAHRKTLLGILDRIDGFAARCASEEYTDSGEAWEVYDATRQDCIDALGLDRPTAIESSPLADAIKRAMLVCESACMDDPTDRAALLSALLSRIADTGLIK